MDCPKAGYAILSSGITELVVPTVCKTWRCRACSIKVSRLVAMKVQYGCQSIGGRSYFITTTYVNNRDTDIRLAHAANREWAELWRRLRLNPLWANAAWWKVPELTKRQQVHFHAIVAGIATRGKGGCRKPTENATAWKARHCSVNCLEHSLSRVWERVTGDSFIVDAQAIRSVVGTAFYVQKYMQKTFDDRVGLQALGFRRRYASSQNWPRLEPLHLRGPDEGWESVHVTNWKTLLGFHEQERYSLMEAVERDKHHPYLVREGTDYALALAIKTQNKRTVAIMQAVTKGVGNDHGS